MRTRLIVILILCVSVSVVALVASRRPTASGGNATSQNGGAGAPVPTQAPPQVRSVSSSAPGVVQASGSPGVRLDEEQFKKLTGLEPLPDSVRTNIFGDLLLRRVTELHVGTTKLAPTGAAAPEWFDSENEELTNRLMREHVADAGVGDDDLTRRRNLYQAALTEHLATYGSAHPELLAAKKAEIYGSRALVDSTDGGLSPR